MIVVQFMHLLCCSMISMLSHILLRWNVENEVQVQVQFITKALHESLFLVHMG